MAVRSRMDRITIEPHAAARKRTAGRFLLSIRRHDARAPSAAFGESIVFSGTGRPRAAGSVGFNRIQEKT